MVDYKISIITATYNAVEYLPRLVDSLRAQTDKNFEWIVADGNSTDGTKEILENITDLNLIVDSAPDFGIYDALNRAISRSNNDYYLVLGADDILYPDAVSSFRKLIKSTNADMITARVCVDNIIQSTRRAWPWLYGAFFYVSCHAVGTLINKHLHEQYGMYSAKFPIAADQLFLLKAGDGGANIVRADFVAGEFATDGVSGSDVLGALTEGLRVQILTGRNRFVQLIIFFLRVIKNYRKI